MLQPHLNWQFQPKVHCRHTRCTAVWRSRGITNGIDTSEWDPAADVHLPAAARYDSSSISQGKGAAKAYFQQQHGLHQAPDIPLIAFVGRLSAQKGADVLFAALPHLLACPSCMPASAGGLPQANAQAQQETTTQRKPVKLRAAQCQIAALGAGESLMPCLLYMAACMVCLTHTQCQHCLSNTFVILTAVSRESGLNSNFVSSICLC